MIKEEIENLLYLDKTAQETNNISPELLNMVDDILLSEDSVDSQVSEEAFLVYKKFSAMKPDAPEGMKKDLFRAIKNYITEKISNKEYTDALLLYRFLAVKSDLEPVSFSDIAEILSSLGDLDSAFEFARLYEQKENNTPLKLLTLGNFYNLCMKDYKTAIKYYEQYLKIDETKFVVYTIVGSLYAKAYGDLSLKDQIYYFEKAYRLKPENRLVLCGLAFGYEKLGDKSNADRFYRELLENYPQEGDFYNYGSFLISCGDFENGHKYFRHRFNVEDKNLKYPISADEAKRWDLVSDISDKTLLVHYEQGYGDTFMYCRFVPLLKNLARKVIFVVQESLYDLIKSSKIVSDGIEVLPGNIDLSELDYDVDMALLDAPFVVDARSENLPYCEKYLEIDDELVKNYAKKYIKPSDNLKVGISYRGNKSSNYMGRDIEFSRFFRVLGLENIDFYSFSKEEEADVRIISLGGSFNNFTDTACALKNMDIVVSTDNVILNLAGALGVKTLGLYNRHTNFRWFKLDGDTGWYKSVRPIQAEDNNCWSPVLSEVINILSEISKK